MSDNHDIDVVLITQDARLRALITRHRPPSAAIRCLEPADLKHSAPPSAKQWWFDLDCGMPAEIGSCQRRVYFYSQLPMKPRELPTGLFLRKPCEVAAITVLWAGLASATGEQTVADSGDDTDEAAVVPTWVFGLHELDLREFCHRCVTRLPSRLGFAEIALYLYDPEQNVLALAEANSKRYVDLAISLAPENRHLLADVARSGKMMIAQDLVESCRLGGMECPPDLEREPDRATVIAPLRANGELHGLLQLNKRCGTDVSEVGLPLGHIFAFLARSLQHARQYLQTRVEARVDRLTGLFNYRWMMEALAKEVRRSQRYGSPLALLMVDLDGLKSVNDRFGHLAGDALLRHTAGKITAALRQIDSASRIGGDEFVVLLPATSLDGARRVAQRILTAIRTDAPVVEQKPLPVAASLGVAQWQRGWDEQRLLQAADKAMYTAKRRGHNELVCHPNEVPAKPTVAAFARRDD